MAITNFPNGVFASPLIGGGSSDVFTGLGNAVFYVDGDNGNDVNDGKSPEQATATIQQAVTLAAAVNAEYKGGSTVYIKAKALTDYTGDPTSYAETIIIPFTGGERMRLVGCGTGRTQGGLPQIKIGAGSTAMITVRAPGCSIENLGINGVSSTGGGILLDDDSAAKSAFGTTINNCHFKNCVGSTATDCRTGGAIMWPAAGNAWQVSITNNRFYKNVGDITMLGNSTNTRPQDILIQGNQFSGYAAYTDCNIWAGGGGGYGSVNIDSNVFGQLPAIGSGSIARYMDLTGTLSGMLTRNFFGCMTAEGGTEITFEAAGTGAKIPVTVFMAGNFGQFITGVGAGLVSGEIYA